MIRNSARLIQFLTWTIAVLLAATFGFDQTKAFAGTETATPKTRKSENSAVLAKVPTNGQCPQPLMDWANDDKKNKRFFLIAPLNSELANHCNYALKNNTTHDVNDLKKTYKDLFADRFKDANVTPINNCPLPNNEDGVLATSKYFTSLRRIDEGLSRVMDEAAAINSTLPNTPYDESFCGDIFKTHKKKCETYKEACKKQATTEEFETLAKDAADAANHIFCINLVDKNCLYGGGGVGIAQKLSYNSSPQLRQCLSVLEEEAPKIFKSPDLIQKTFCDSKRNKEVINQTITTYPFLFGDEFKKTINTDVMVQPIFSRSDALQGYEVTGPSAGKFPFDPTQVQKAMTAQLTVNRDGLRETKKDFETAYDCLTGQKTSGAASKEKCTPEFLNRVTNGFPMADEHGNLKDTNRQSAYQLYECQQRVIDRHTERDQMVSMSNEGFKTVIITGVSALSGGLTTPALLARLASLSRLTRVAIGVAAVGSNVGITSLSAQHAYDSCIKGKPTAALTLAQNQALSSKTCPSQSSSASQGMRLANSCLLDSAFTLADSLSVGLAGLGVRNVQKAAQEAASAAHANANGAETAANAAAATPSSSGGPAIGADAAESSETAANKAGPPPGIAERRKPEVQHLPGETSKAHRSPNREKFVNQYLRRPVSADKNEAWVSLGSKVRPDGKIRVLDKQNMSTKKLNDTLLDKDLVTALNNKHNEMTDAAIADLLKKHPEVQIVAVKKADSLPESQVDDFIQAHPKIESELKASLSHEGFERMFKAHPEMKKDLEALYEDFKSQRIIFGPVPPHQQIPAKWDKDLDKTLQQTNVEFEKFVRDNKLVRESGDAGKWFRFGYGETGDQANLATRFSRDQTKNRLYHFSERRVQKALKKTMSQAEDMRQSLHRELGNSGLWDTEAGRKSFKTDVFELARKSNTPEELRTQISKSLSVEITPAQAKKIMDYSKSIDEFSPGINIIQRENASLTGAVHGGISIDFKGMGGQNLKETAEALAGNRRNLNLAIEDARLGEGAVTEAFKRKRELIRSTVERIAKENGIVVDIKASGDDMVIIPDKPFSKRVRDQISDALAKDVPPSSIRMSSIPAGVNAEARGTLGTIGESIEKQLRKNLQQLIPKEKLDQVLFRVDMRNPGSTQAPSLSTSTSGVSMSSKEQEIIDKAFKDAVKEVEKKTAPTPKPKPSNPMAPPTRTYIPRPDFELAA